jgi:hypothetical protein
MGRQLPLGLEGDEPGEQQDERRGEAGQELDCVEPLHVVDDPAEPVERGQAGRDGRDPAEAEERHALVVSW